MILLYRPSNNKIIWSQNGPWLKQHYINIIDSSRIGIFANNVIDSYSNFKHNFIDDCNCQYIYDFSQNLISKPYEKFFKSSKIATITGGLSRILNNGEIFVDDANNGRIILGNYKEEIWTYVEKINDGNFSSLHWSRYITEEEFKTFTFLEQNNN